MLKIERVQFFTHSVQQVYRIRYESRRSSKLKLHLKNKNKIKYGEKLFLMVDGILSCTLNVA